MLKSLFLQSFLQDVLLCWNLGMYMNTDNSGYLKVIVYSKLLISQSKFSGPRKFTLRYQQFEIKGLELK